jgi:hypothetical protein
MTFTVTYKPSAQTSQKKTPITEDVFPVLLLSTGHGVEHTENKSCDSYRASPLVC